MFDEKEIKNLLKNLENSEDDKIKYINNKIKKHDYLYINILELNYLYQINNINKFYDITMLKNFLHSNNIGYTAIIKNVGIPKATLSKLLNKDRNVKLSKLNNLFEKLNDVFNLNINKNIIEKGV